MSDELDKLTPMELHSLLDEDDRFEIIVKAFEHVPESTQDRVSNESEMWLLEDYCKNHRSEIVKMIRGYAKDRQ